MKEINKKKKFDLSLWCNHANTAIISIIILIFHFTPALFEIYILSFLVEELDQIGDHNLKHELEKYKNSIVNK